MESEKELKTLQKIIFNAIDGIFIPPLAGRRFLTIMNIRMGRGHEIYRKFEQILNNPDLQWEMLQAPENHKLKNDFNILCHIVLKSYIEDAENEEEKLLSDYFIELEKRTQEHLRLFSFSQIKLNFTELLSLEEKVINSLPSAEKNATQSTDNQRRLLSAWLMYPEAMYNLPQIKQIAGRFAALSCR